MFQTYKFKGDHTNKAKLEAIREVGVAYRNYFNEVMQRSLSDFYKTLGKVPRYLPVLEAPAGFSERYKQTCAKQVRTTLASWLSNLQNRVVTTITGSSLCDETKKQLYFINKYGLWFKKEVKMRDVPIPASVVKLSRKIYHHCRGRHPKLRNVTMSLDAKVATIEKSSNSFDYWIKMATLDSGNPIYLPVESYPYYENKQGLLKRQVQVIIKPDKIEFGFVKDIEFQKVEPIKGKRVGVDTGVCIPLSTSTGNQYGQDLYRKLKRIDAQIVKLVRMRMKNGLYNKSAKLNRLYSKARSLLKNEIGRITNQFLLKENPEEIVLENNKCLTIDALKTFSRRMRRIIKNSGINRLRDVLVEKSEKQGRTSSKVNQAYTSQECPVCHHIHSDNRKTQKVFCCVKCGFKRNADYVGAVNVRDRRSIPGISIYTPYKLVRGLVEAFYARSPVLQL